MVSPTFFYLILNLAIRSSLYFGGFPSGSVVKNPPANAGDPGSISGSGRYPGGRNQQLTPVFFVIGTKEPGGLQSKESL